MSDLYESDDDLAEELARLVALDPSVDAERGEWMRLATRIDKKLKHLETFGDFERDRFFYASHFVNEGSTFSRHADYYEQEREKIRGMLSRYFANHPFNSDALKRAG